MAAGVAGGGGGNAARTQAASRVLVPRGWQAGNLARGNVIHAVLASGGQEWRRQGWAASAAGWAAAAAAMPLPKGRAGHANHTCLTIRTMTSMSTIKCNYMQSYVAAHPERMFMYRKREILRSARQHIRLPSKRSISRYSIIAEELAGLIMGTQEAANRTGLSTHVWSIFPTPHGYARSSKPNEPVYTHTFFAPHVLEGGLRNRCGITIMALWHCKVRTQPRPLAHVAPGAKGVCDACSGSVPHAQSPACSWTWQYSGVGEGAVPRTSEVQRGESRVLLERGGQRRGPSNADAVVCNTRGLRDCVRTQARMARAQAARCMPNHTHVHGRGSAAG